MRLSFFFDSFRQTITIFLEGLWRQGMLFGTKASEAFFVKCDRSTMAQDDLDNGRLICRIGIAPVKPAAVFRCSLSIHRVDVRRSERSRR